MALIKTQGLVKKFNHSGNIINAVNGINLSIEKGKTYGLAGESGCGKSTLASMLSLLTKPDEGHILFNSKDINTLSKHEEKEFRKKVQIVFQNPYESLNPKMKISSILEEPLLIHKIGNSREERKCLINEIRTMCALDSAVLDKYPLELSGGQCQRISIASAMLLKPEFLILDEPVSSLDVLIQAQIINILKLMQKSMEMTYLFISHNLNVVSYISDVIGIMYLGNIVEEADTEEILKNPVHPYTKTLFSASYNSYSSYKGESMAFTGKLTHPESKSCPFCLRCPHCKDICLSRRPESKELKPGHKVSCHLV